MTSTSTSSVASVVKSLRKQLPFSVLSEREHQELFSSATLLKCSLGQRIVRPDVLPDRVFVVLRGKVRLLAQSSMRSRTLDLRGPGQLLGWVSLLRASPCEWITASEKTLLLAIPSADFIKAINQNQKFDDYFGRLSNLHEIETIIQSVIKSTPEHKEGWRERLDDVSKNAWMNAIKPGSPFIPSPDHQGLDWFLSTDGVPGINIGSRIKPGDVLPERSGFSLRYRLVGLRRSNELDPVQTVKESSPSDIELNFSENSGQTLTKLGILEEDFLALDEKFPLIKGRGRFAEAMAVCEMAAMVQSVPFRKDSIA